MRLPAGRLANRRDADAGGAVQHGLNPADFRLPGFFGMMVFLWFLGRRGADSGTEEGPKRVGRWFSDAWFGGVVQYFLQRSFAYQSTDYFSVTIW